MKFLHIRVIIVFLLFILSVSCNTEPDIFLSPDSNIKVKMFLSDHKPVFDLFYKGKPILKNSALGLKIDDESFNNKYSIVSIEDRSVNEEWKPVVGKVSLVKNNYNEYLIKLKEKKGKYREVDVTFRLYDDGVAFRYNIPVQDDIDTYVIEEDLTSLNFTHDMSWWTGNDEHPNLHSSTLDSLPSIAKPPLVAQFDSSVWVSFCEGAIYNYSDFTIKKGNEPNSVGCQVYPSKGKTGMPTSWRVIQLGETAGVLLESNILENLNPECKIEDVSWIKPGKAMWDWRVWKYVAPDGYEYGLNTVSHKRFVDFASEHNIKYLVIDADWYGPEFEENSDPTKSRDGIDIHEIIDYANKRDVGIILYINDVGAKKYGLDNVLHRFHEWGAAGIKYGFMEGQGQEKVKHTRLVVETCAKYKLLVNFHDLPVPPSGDTRTWPNLIAREYCHAQADAKRSYWPETAVSAAFVNMLLGPLDMGNGWYDLNNAEKRKRVFQEIPGTVAAETAKLVVFYSGLMILPDAPEEYEKKADLFEFVEDLPDSYDAIKVLGGTPDTYISIARRKGEKWYVGSLTNRESRSLKISLDFLDKNKNYIAKIYKDAPDSHFLTNKESYEIQEMRVNNNSVVDVDLAPGGGCSILLSPVE